MAHQFRPVDRDAEMLLPHNMLDWVPEGHAVRVVISAVERLMTRDLAARLVPPAPKGSAAGPARYDPVMLLTGPLVALAWILLFGGPAAAAVLAGRRCRGPDGDRLPHTVRFGQGVAAGLLANGTAAMAITTLGTGTTVLMLKSPWLLHWLNYGRHLTAFATYRYELYTTNHAGAYVLMLMFFPVIGLLMSTLAAGIANPAPLNARSSLPMTSGE